MLLLVENILDVRRSENHLLKLYYQNCNLRAVVNESNSDVDFLTQSADISISNLVDPISLRFNKEIINRVIVNLLTNAIKHSKKKG